MCVGGSNLGSGWGSPGGKGGHPRRGDTLLLKFIQEALEVFLIFTSSGYQ